MDVKEPTRWEKRKRRTRQHLQSCTLELLLEKGYQDLTIQNITDCADYARGTFYVHFADKDEIVWTIFEEDLQRLSEAVLRTYSDAPPEQRKFLTWKAAFAYAQQQRDLLRVMLGEQGHPAFAQRLQDYIAQFIEAGLASGVFDPQINVKLPQSFAAQFMTGALVRLMLWSLDTDYTPEQLAQMFYETLYRRPMPSELSDE